LRFRSSFQVEKYKPKNNPFLFGLQQIVDEKYEQFSTRMTLSFERSKV
jgi:hypothetical protein